MKRFKSLILMIAVAAIAASPLNAQAERRIQFPKGKSSTVVRGSTGGSGITYVLRARSGQKIVIDLSPAAGLGIKVETTGRYGHMVMLREESGGHYEVGLEESGDYTIFVGSTSRRPVSFVMKVGVTMLADV